MTFLIAYNSENGVKMIIRCLNKKLALDDFKVSNKNDINKKYHSKTELLLFTQQK